MGRSPSALLRGEHSSCIHRDRGSGALPSNPAKLMVTVSNVERLCLDTTPGKRTEGWHQGEGTGLRASSGTGWPWVPHFRCDKQGVIFILCL